MTRYIILKLALFWDRRVRNGGWWLSTAPVYLSSPGGVMQIVDNPDRR